LNASATATRTTSADTSNLSTLQAANANYTADIINFKKGLSYKWNVGTGITNETSSTGSNNQKITGFGVHSLYQPIPINESSMLNLNANQSLSSSYDRLYGMSTTLSHSGNVSWNGSKNNSLSGTANMTVGDVRIFGFNESDYQYATLQLDGRKQFSINASLSANVGLNWSHQSQAGQTTTSVNSSVSYRHTRAFNVRGLRYLILFSANTSAYDARLLGNVDAQRTQSGYSLEQHLDYHIGLLDTSLAAIASELDGKQNASIFMRIGRNFGNM
jgi:hypothetical protein